MSSILVLVDLFCKQPSLIRVLDKDCIHEDAMEQCCQPISSPSKQPMHQSINQHPTDQGGELIVHWVLAAGESMQYVVHFMLTLGVQEQHSADSLKASSVPQVLYEHATAPAKQQCLDSCILCLTASLTLTIPLPTCCFKPHRLAAVYVGIINTSCHTTQVHGVV